MEWGLVIALALSAEPARFPKGLAPMKLPPPAAGLKSWSDAECAGCHRAEGQEHALSGHAVARSSFVFQAGAKDERPLIRHAASIAYSTLLKVMLGFRGTDTHGLKAFRRLALLDTVRACLVDKDVFASEFVIRADRGGITIKEIPVHVIEKRPPSINLFKRVPNVMKSLAKLTFSIRIRG